MKITNSTKKFMEEHPKLVAFLNFIYPYLFLIFGIIVGYALNVDSIQDNCNQFIIDNYFTLDIQRCLLDMNQDFILPNGSVINYEAGNIYNFSPS